MLTPLDIHQKEFHHAFRGYNPDEVDEFLDQLVGEWEQLLREKSALGERIEDAEQKLQRFRQLENTLQNTLVVAQETSEDVKENARREAELIVREAELQAGRLIRETEQKARRIVEEAQGQARQAEERFQEIQRQALAFRAHVRSLLESQLEVLRGDSGGIPLLAAASEREKDRDEES